MAPWLASLDQSLVIARPDNYVYGSASTPAAGIDMLQQFLRDLST